MERRKEEVVALIDADFIPYYVCHNKDGEPEKTLADCKRLADEFIQSICVATKADKFACFLTVGKCFRYDINSTYKANRKYLPIKFLSEVKEHILVKYNSYYDFVYEADDLVISYKKANPQYECIIVSPDKDILNLEGMHYNPRKGEMKYTLPEEEWEYFWKSMIIGDSADGIKGIPGKGKVFADDVLSMFDIADTFYPMHSIVLREYIKHFGEYEGIKEFTKNYLSLKIVDNVFIKDVKLNNVMGDETTETTG